MDSKILAIVGKFQLKKKTKKNLPAFFFFTDRKKLSNIFEVVENLPKGTAIIIREYDLDFEERLEFAKKISAIARKNHLKILVGKDYKLAREIKADGVHFSDYSLSPSLSFPRKRESSCLKRILDSRFRGNDKVGRRNDKFVSYSCHNLKSVLKAKKLGVDLIFYSPIFTTSSHPNQKPCGTLQLRNIALKSSLPLYALGGINKDNIRQLIGCGIAGIGGISIFK